MKMIVDIHDSKTRRKGNNLFMFVDTNHAIDTHNFQISYRILYSSQYDLIIAAFD